MPSLTDDGFGLPLAKRQKTGIDLDARRKQPSPASKIFSPFRTIGLVSPTTVPFTSVRLGKSTFQVTTSAGRSLQTYDLRKGLNLVFVTRPQTPEIITATFAWQDKVFAAWGNPKIGPFGVWVFKRGRKTASLEVPAGLIDPIERLLVFGSWIVGCGSRSIHVWKNGSFDYYTTLSPSHSGDLSGEEIYTGRICNMPTYLNKVFVGRYDGSVDIWNVKTGKLVFSIPPGFSDAGPVTALQPSPVLSVIAIAYRSGALSIQNVKTSQVILSSLPEPSKPRTIMSLTFRSDGLGAGEEGKQSGALATTCMGSSDVTIWDLNKGGRVMGVLRGAHKMPRGQLGSAINHIEFLDGQPVLVSSGIDNSLRTWVFDEMPFNPIPRPLHARRGHSATITALSFLPSSSDGSESTSKWLLSGSKDSSLWGFSLRKDSQNTEISQGSVDHKARKKGDRSHVGEQSILKAPEITCIACSLNRDGGIGASISGPVWTNPKSTNTEMSNKTGWESVITGHRGDKYARTWFWGKKKAGRWAFETADGMNVQSVAISQCGTFALVGSMGGSISMFNMQSGLYRQSFPSNAQRRKLGGNSGISNHRVPRNTQHTKAVTGLAIDGLNQIVVSCGLDGKVKFWDFVSGVLVEELDWYSITAITGLRYNNTSELVAFSCDDLSIRIVDMETRNVVRELWGCSGQINDFTFSNDGRWIIAASMDSTIRVWDLPTGHLIDILRVPSTCTALAMSSTGDFLATAHADGVGIGLWSNRSLFVPVSTRHLSTTGDFVNSSFPTSPGEGGIGAIEAAFLPDHEEIEDDGPVPSSVQLSRDMMTLSVVPKNKWQTLLHLDSIKKRNMPKEPPKAPQTAPFFLPASSELEPKKAFDGILSKERVVAERSRITTVTGLGANDELSSQFRLLLRSGCLSGNFEAFIDHMISMPPTKLELEIRSLDPKVQEGRSELSTFVLALSSRLSSKRDFDLINAWMAVFLKVHADTVAECSEVAMNGCPTLRDALAVWGRIQEQETQRLAELVGYCRGVVGFLRSSR